MEQRPESVARFASGGRHRPTLSGSIRYLGVIIVWLGLMLIRPRLAWRIFENRRADSPIPRAKNITAGRTLKAASVIWSAGLLRG